jgi:hypothetical protein
MRGEHDEQHSDFVLAETKKPVQMDLLERICEINTGLLFPLMCEGTADNKAWQETKPIVHFGK